MITNSDVIQVRTDKPSGTIILNRVGRLNALTADLVEKFSEALSDLHQQKSVRAVIVTGSGNFFSSGTDLFELKEKSLEQNAMQIWHEDCSRFSELLEQMLRFPKPIIAALNGPALGSAAALMLAADLVVAGNDSWLQFPESKIGLVPGMTAPLLSFRAGAGIASRLMLTSEQLSAQRAFELGIYHELVSPELVWARSNELACQIENNSAQSQLMTKQILNETVGEQVLMALQVGAANTAAARTTDSAAEGIAAFVEKREAKW